MSSYLHRFKAKAIVEYLDAFEQELTFGGSDGKFEESTFLLLIGDFRKSQPSGHLDTDLNSSCTAFLAEYRKEPRASLVSALRLRSMLVEKYAANERVVFYKDSNTVVIDRVAYEGLEPEQFQILEYLCKREPNEWVRIRDMIRDIGILNDVSERTVRRYISAPKLCPEIRALITERAGKGHRILLPPLPLSGAAE